MREAQVLWSDCTKWSIAASANKPDARDGLQPRVIRNIPRTPAGVRGTSALGAREQRLTGASLVITL